MSNDKPVVDPTSSVMSIDDDAFPGRLGYLLLDQSVEQVVALTAAQMAGSGLVSSTTQQRIGASSGNRKLQDHRIERRPADTMLMPVVLERGVALSSVQLRDLDGEPILPTKWVHDIPHLLGQIVLIHTSKETPKKARVLTTRGHFIMPVDYDDNEVHFDQAIELQSLDGGPLTQAGDAGCLVTTVSGDAIGIIICGMDDISYAAPIARMIDELEDCTGITSQMVANASEEETQPPEATGDSGESAPSEAYEQLEHLLAEYRDTDTLDEVDMETAERVKEGFF